MWYIMVERAEVISHYIDAVLFFILVPLYLIARIFLRIFFHLKQYSEKNKNQL